MQTPQIERSAVEAMHNRAKQLVLTSGWLGKAQSLRSAQASMHELHTLLNSNGPAFAAARDASMGGYQPLAGFEAAWAALPVDAKNFTVAEVQQFLGRHGVKVAPETVSNLHVDTVGNLKNSEIAAVDLNDKHDAARAEFHDGSGLHDATPFVVGAEVQADGLHIGAESAIVAQGGAA